MSVSDVFREPSCVYKGNTLPYTSSRRANIYQLKVFHLCCMWLFYTNASLIIAERYCSAFYPDAF